MSPSIWTQSGASSNVRSYEGKGWRVVQSQQLVGTRALVDSVEEQELLEELIDAHKPPPPRGPGFDGLHYLLATSFRYPPLRYGSRFGTRVEPSLWYGSEGLSTAFAEVAYYRLVFLAGTEAEIELPLHVDLTSFRAGLRSAAFVDLTGAAFEPFWGEVSSPVRYEVAQQLGREMREAGVELFRYRSARCGEGGANLGMFTATAFARKQPYDFCNWLCVVTATEVELSQKDFLERRRFHFPREQFEVAGTLPAPAV
jgi:hypothetical protein